jgi:predicted nucleotidyltransferase
VRGKISKRGRTARDITPEEMEVYRRTAHKRWEEQQYKIAKRRERAWEVARRAALILKEEYGAQHVVAFGSLVRERGFHLRSDVDLAVWGVEEKLFCRAIARLLDIDPDISVDLVEAEEVQPSLKRAIEKEGIVL